MARAADVIASGLMAYDEGDPVGRGFLPFALGHSELGGAMARPH